VLFVLLLGGVGYDGWRLYPLVRQWRSSYVQLLEANRRAYTAIGTGHDRLLIYGSIDRCGWPGSANDLPGAVYSRWWMDDPAVSPAMEKLIPKYLPEAVAAGTTPVRAVLSWKEVDFKLERRLEQAMLNSPLWEERDSGIPQARLFVRRGQPEVALVNNNTL